jgi:hypothetical protein
MIIKEVEDFESDEFKQSIAMYESSFPSNEKRSSEKVTEMLQNNKNYRLIISLNNETVVYADPFSK